MADERSTPLNQGTGKWLQVTDTDQLETWNGTDKMPALKESLGINDKASLSGTNTFQEKQTLSKDAEINSLTVGRGAGGISTNTANGFRALRDNTTGNNNTANGHQALQDNTTGVINTANGRNALFNNTEGSENTASGVSALSSNTTGTDNTANGRSALRDNTTGNNNIGIGFGAGRSNSPFTVTTQDNRIVIGNNDHTDAYIRIGWTVTSDKRDKTNFAEVPYGLDFVKELKPTKFQFREERGSEYTDGKDRYGFLAQDILELEGDEPVIIDNEDPENLKFKESHLVPVLVNAIQELTKEVETLKEKINE